MESQICEAKPLLRLLLCPCSVLKALVYDTDPIDNGGVISSDIKANSPGKLSISRLNREAGKSSNIDK